MTYTVRTVYPFQENFNIAVVFYLCGMFRARRYQVFLATAAFDKSATQI